MFSKLEVVTFIDGAQTRGVRFFINLHPSHIRKIAYILLKLDQSQRKEIIDV